MITIKETTAKELDNVKALWADGDVMKFVGFPDGLLQTDDEMKARLDWIESQRPQVNHYSIFDGSVYCGETFYSIDSKHGNNASMDIKLFGFARGKGIAAKALSYAIEQAFENGAEKVWVDPNPNNEKALALYDDVFASYGGDLYEVADAVYEKLTDENAPQGVLTVAKAPSPEPKHTGLTIILDGVADPGNVGTVIRCADAFGAERVILGDGSADAFGQKTVRAAMGSLFRVPTERASLAETIEKLKNDGYTVYAAMLDRDSVCVDAVEKGGRLAFVIGNEGHGISDEVRGACDGSVIIPMRDDGAESLNAAVAASVIMWEHKRI